MKKNKVESNQRGTSKYNTKQADENKHKRDKRKHQNSDKPPDGCATDRIRGRIRQRRRLCRWAKTQKVKYCFITMSHKTSILSLIPRATAPSLHPTEHPAPIGFSPGGIINIFI